MGYGIGYRSVLALTLLMMISSFTVYALDIIQMPEFPKQTGIGGGVIFHDLDRDGIDEVIATGDGKVFAWRLDGTPYLNNPDGLFFSIGKDYYIFAPPAVGDIDGDGTEEIVISADKLYVLDSDGKSIMDMEVGGESRAAPVVADINKDGRLEIIGIGHRPGAYSIFIYDCNGELIPGFPMGNIALSSPAVLDFDPNVDGLELVWGEVNGEVLAVHNDGSRVTGFPVPSQGELSIGECPSAGDIDNDGTPEIVVGTYNRTMLAIDENGRFKSGWPIQTEKISSSAALADIDHDGSLEIFVGSYEGNLYGFDSGGNQLAGFPKKTGGKISSVIIADIDNDSVPEVIANSKDGKLYSWKTTTGEPVEGFPIDYGTPVYYSPAIGTDRNGHTLMAISVDEKFYLYDLGPNTYNPDMQPWPMIKHDPQRTGNYDYVPNKEIPNIDRTPPQWISTAGIQDAFQVDDNTVRIYWNRAIDNESNTVRYNLYISEVLYGATTAKKKIEDIRQSGFNLSDYDCQFDIDPSIADLKQDTAYRFEITAEDDESNKTTDAVYREVQMLDFMTISEINESLLSDQSGIVNKEIVTEMMGLSYVQSLLADALDIGKLVYDLLTLQSLRNVASIGLGLAGLSPTAFAREWLRERTTYMTVAGTNPGESLDWYQVVSPVDSDTNIGKGWPVIAKVKVIEKITSQGILRSLKVISFHHNWSRFDFLPDYSYHPYSFDNLNNSEINYNLIGAKCALVGCIESRWKDGSDIIFRLHNMRSTDEASKPVYIRIPYKDTKLPVPHSVVGVYGTIGTYNGCHCIEADGIKLIVGSEYRISEENKESIYTGNVISTVESPVDLHIYDSVGNHTGAVYDSEGNVTGIETKIPNSIYLGPDIHPELIVIADPKTGPYRLEVNGIDDGSYTLTTTANDSENEEIYRIRKENIPVVKGQTDVMKIPIILNGSGDIVVESLPADVNNDGAVDMLDMDLVIQSFGSKQGDASYNPDADINGDGVINILDLVLVGKKFDR